MNQSLYEFCMMSDRYEFSLQYRPSHVLMRHLIVNIPKSRCSVNRSILTTVSSRSDAPGKTSHRCPRTKSHERGQPCVPSAINAENLTISLWLLPVNPVNRRTVVVAGPIVHDWVFLDDNPTARFMAENVANAWLTGCWSICEKSNISSFMKFSLLEEFFRYSFTAGNRIVTSSSAVDVRRANAFFRRPSNTSWSTQ